MKNSNRSVDERVRTLITSSVSDSLETSLSSSSSSSSSSFTALADGSSWKKDVALATFPLIIRFRSIKNGDQRCWKEFSLGEQRQSGTVNEGNQFDIHVVLHGRDSNLVLAASRPVRVDRLTKVLLAMPRRRRYFSMAETRASGSVFTGPLFHCFNVLH